LKGQKRRGVIEMESSVKAFFARLLPQSHAVSSNLNIIILWCIVKKPGPHPVPTNIYSEDGYLKRSAYTSPLMRDTGPEGAGEIARLET